MPHRLCRSHVSALARTLLLATLPCAVAAWSAPPGPAIGLSREAIPADSAWKKLVLDIPGEFATPRAVSIEGNAASVQNPNGLLAPKDGGTRLTTTAAGSTRLIVDFGQLASGYVEIGVKQATAPIRLAYAEMRQSLGREGDASTDKDDFFYHGRTLGTDDDPDGRSDVFPPSANSAVLKSPGLRGSERYIAITLDGPGTATFDFIRVRQTYFRGAYDGHFLSSDEELNRAWYASAYAVDLSTIRDQRKNPQAGWVIVDGPKRDRVVYAADLRVHGLSAYYQGAAFRNIVRDSINLFGCQQDPDGSLPAASVIDVPCKLGDPGPPDGPPSGFEPPAEAGLARLDSFTAWWVIALADYQRYTGDRELVASLLPVARRIIQFFAAHSPDGPLWKTDNYNQKMAFNWHTPDKAIGFDSYSNEAYYGALLALAGLERDVAHDPAAAQRLETLAGQVKAAVLQKFWDPAAGALVLNSENPKRDHTADTNAGALLFGILDDQQALSVMEFLRKRLGTAYGTATSEFPDDPYMTRYISPYILVQESLGRFRYGDGAGALRLYRTAWTHMLRNGPGTPWEEIGMDGRPVNPRPGTSITTGELVDAAHAWSTVIPGLSMYVLGVRPLTDGYTQWRVSPMPVDLKWVQGDVPTPAGKISVRWKRGDGDSSFVLTVDAPPATSGEVLVPLLGSDRTIAMDGRLVWEKGHAMADVQAHRDQDNVVFPAVKGAHTFAWSH